MNNNFYTVFVNVLLIYEYILFITNSSSELLNFVNFNFNANFYNLKCKKKSVIFLFSLKSNQNFY